MLPSSQVPHQVAGAIHASIRDRRERISQKSFVGQLRTAEIAPRDSGTADVKLARHAHGQWLPRLIEHVKLCVRDRATDRQRLRSDRRQVVARIEERARDRGFGNSIQLCICQPYLKFVWLAVSRFVFQGRGLFFLPSALFFQFS